MEQIYLRWSQHSIFFLNYIFATLHSRSPETMEGTFFMTVIVDSFIESKIGKHNFLLIVVERRWRFKVTVQPKKFPPPNPELNPPNPELNPPSPELNPPNPFRKQKVSPRNNGLQILLFWFERRPKRRPCFSSWAAGRVDASLAIRASTNQRTFRLSAGQDRLFNGGRRTYSPPVSSSQSVWWWSDCCVLKKELPSTDIHRLDIATYLCRYSNVEFKVILVLLTLSIDIGWYSWKKVWAIWTDINCLQYATTSQFFLLLQWKILIDWHWRVLIMEVWPLCTDNNCLQYAITSQLSSTHHYWR